MTDEHPQVAAPSPKSPRAFKWAPFVMNAGLLLLLTVMSFNMAKGAIELSFLSYMMSMMLGVGILGVANAVVALVLARKGRKDLALSFLLSAIFVGLVGTGLCFAGGSYL